MSTKNLEILCKELKKIKKMGFIEAKRKGPTAVGYTLETLLGIKENRSRDPDWGKYEIKTKRIGKSNNSSLFVPKWKYLKVKNWREMVKNYGEPYEKRDGSKAGKALLHGAPYGIEDRHGWKIEFDSDFNLFLFYKNNHYVIDSFSLI